MCLVVDKEKINEFYKNPKKVYTFYKTFYVVDNYLLTPFIRHKIKKYGIIKAKGVLTIYIRPDQSIEIDGGCCHAYTSRTKTSLPALAVNIPIQVKAGDIISFGNERDVCFFRYEITKKTWDRVFKGK